MLEKLLGRHCTLLTVTIDANIRSQLTIDKIKQWPG